MKILVHACCGPCSTECIRLLEEAGHEVAIANYNPNIQPFSEREERAHALEQHASLVDTHVVSLMPETDAWEERVAIHGMNDQARCPACYLTRFEPIAEEAQAEGVAISSTLSISPYQDGVTIRKSLEVAAGKAGTEAVALDFTPWFTESERRSKKEGLYRQNYCGCRFSAARASMDRAEVRNQRKQDKLIRRMKKRAARQEM